MRIARTARHDSVGGGIRSGVLFQQFRQHRFVAIQESLGKTVVDVGSGYYIMS